jgi:hypothetical protein
MSYHTRVSLVSPPPKSVDVAPMRQALEARCDELGISRDVISDVETLFTVGAGSIKVWPSHVSAILQIVSKQQPETRLVVRGKGEDETESWAYAFEGGTRTVAKPREAKDTKLSSDARVAIAKLEANPAAEKYSPRTRYTVGMVLEHVSFGKGIVLQSQETKIVVQFSDAERTLVHGRPA